MSYSGIKRSYLSLKAEELDACVAEKEIHYPEGPKEVTFRLHCIMDQLKHLIKFFISNSRFISGGLAIC